MANKAEKSAFVSRIWEAVQAQPSLYGLFPSVIIAQAALESAWGSSELSNHNNYFGVKASETQYSPAWIPSKSRTVELPTKEYKNGKYITVMAKWRVYDNVTDSIRDRNALVATNNRYADARKAATPLDQITAMKAGGYATDPDYVSKIMATINSNDLTKYDKLYQGSHSSVISEQPYGGRTQNKSKHPWLVVILVVLLLIGIVAFLSKTKKIKLIK